MPNTTTPASSDGPAGLDEGAFGDLGVICQPGDGATSPSSDPGLTEDSIQIGTFSDPGFSGRPGLNQELFDTAEAFTAWCNEHGGINGRQIDLKLRDAKLTEYQQRVIEACTEGDFMSVGGGAAFDDTGQADRLGCALPTITGYAVSAEASGADLSIQPLPNPSNELSIGSFQYLDSQFPESVASRRHLQRQRACHDYHRGASQRGDHIRARLERRLRRRVQRARRDELAALRRGDEQRRRSRTHLRRRTREPRRVPHRGGVVRRRVRLGDRRRKRVRPVADRRSRHRRRWHLRPHVDPSVPDGRRRARQRRDAAIPRVDGALRPRRQDRIPRCARSLGVAAVREGRQRMWRRTEPRLRLGEGLGDHASGPAAVCT